MRYRTAAVCLFLIIASCNGGAPIRPNGDNGNGETGDKDYSTRIPAGALPFRKLELPEWPDLTRAIGAADDGFAAAAMRSETWFTAPSAKTHFPMHGINWNQARASVFAMRSLIAEGGDAEVLETRMKTEFDCYRSIGCDNEGTVLFTGYYSPTFKASKTRGGIYQHALYKPPRGLDYDSTTGKPSSPYHSRQILETEEGALLPRDEIIFLTDKFEAFLCHVNGSAKLELEDGSIVYVGYAANNGWEYTSVGQELIKDKKIPKHSKLPAIRQYFRDHPDDVDQYLARNARYIFFKFYDGTDWPAGSLGFPVTPRRSLATDKKIFPRGGVVLVDTQLPEGEFAQFMLDQDTGGAIQAPGRADVFIGIGDAAEETAGGTRAEGQLYYFFLKPSRVGTWLAKMGG